MSELVLNREDLRSSLQLLRKDYEIFGPKLQPGGGRLSDTDVTDYALLEDFDELCWDHKTTFSPKEFFLPVTEELMIFDGNSVAASQPSVTPRVLFLRPCDTHALKRMDAHFLKGLKDTNYEIRRANTILFVMECTQSWDSCFCKTMGTEKPHEPDLLIRKLGQGEFYLRLENSELEKYFPPSHEVNSIEVCSHIEEKRWNVALPQIDESVNSFQVWRDYGKRCIGCGGCNFVCPTCFCFTVRDETKEDGSIARQRVWSSCQVEGFARVAGGYEYRENQADKGRFKFMHKFSHFKAVHGVDLCVGCGRCVEACPEYIDIRATMAKVDLESKLARMREEDEPLYTTADPNNRDQGRIA